MTTRRALPSGLTAGRQTPVFTAESVPPALLGSHHTTVWAQLVVIEGSVEFVEESPPWSTTASPDAPAVVVPDRRHHIEPSPDARFYIQFYDSEDR